MDDDTVKPGAAGRWFQPMAQMTATIVIVTLTRLASSCAISARTILSQS